MTTNSLLTPEFTVNQGEETVVRIKTEGAEAGMLTCTVTERNGLPIRNTRFALNQENYQTEAISDENGVLIIPYRKGLPLRGTLTISIDARRIHPEEGGKESISWENEQYPTVCFSQLTRQTVFIVDEDGKPVESAELVIERNTNSFARSMVYYRCPEGGAGKYDFEVLPLGASIFYLTTNQKNDVEQDSPQSQVDQSVYVENMTSPRTVIAKQEITGEGDLYLTWRKPKTVVFRFVDGNSNPVPRVFLFQVPPTYNRWNGNEFRFWLEEVEMTSRQIEMAGFECWSKEDGTAAFPMQSGLYPLVGYYHEDFGLGFVHEEGQHEGERLIRLRPACQVSMPPLEGKGFRYLAILMDDGMGGGSRMCGITIH